MDYNKLTLTELKNGYRYDEQKDSYICNYCEKIFEGGQIFSINNKFYLAKYAISKHIEIEHNGNFTQLIDSDTKYNTLTENQKELLKLFRLKISNYEIAKKLGISESTVRQQRFTFREKAKQAKLYLAMYEQAFENIIDKDDIIPIHNSAVCVDERYLITEEEKQHILEATFSSLNPLILKTFPKKEKKKIVILTKIAEQFKHNRQYSEKEINQILKPIYEDYSTIRRYLIVYGFMERTKDSSKYWLTE